MAYIRNCIQVGGALNQMALFTQSRLSVQPVTDAEWAFVLSLEEESELMQPLPGAAAPGGLPASELKSITPKAGSFSRSRHSLTVKKKGGIAAPSVVVSTQPGVDTVGRGKRMKR